jgi:hypothetical protein
VRAVALSRERETSVGTVEDAELESARWRLCAKGVRVGKGRIRLSEIAPDAYRRFDRRRDRDFRIVLDPAAR